MAVFQIEGEEVIDKLVGHRTSGSSSQIYLHKKYAGRRVKVVILSNNGDGRAMAVQGVERVPRETGDEEFA